MRGYPLAVRLTAWYALTALLLVIGSAWFQYRALAFDLAQEDDELLVQTMTAVHSGFVAPSWSVTTPSTLGPFVRDLDAECRVVGGAKSPELPPPRCDTSTVGDSVFRTWYSPAGRHWRLFSSYVATPRPHWVQVILDRGSDDLVLGSYRHKLAFVLPTVLLLAVLAGYVVARRELSTLTSLSTRLARIDARTLDQHLDAEVGPPEIRALVGSFDALLGRLNAAFAALTRFSGELAHELRTPVHVLRQQAEVALQRARTPEEYREVLGSSLEELDRMRRMIDDILFLARAEDPRVAVQRAHLDLAHEVRDVAAFLEAEAAERGVEIACRVPGALAISADRMLVRRALVNVVANAIRHTPPGGRVEIIASESESAVMLVVGDTGEGIAPELLPHVFDRYVRGRAADGAGAAGSGLGLAIVRGIMTLHGGTASIASRLGEGTRVSLNFPHTRTALV